MVDVNADAKAEGFRRVELLTGPARRRPWPDETKARIVAESFEPDAVVSQVARRWQVSPQQLFTWRRELRQAQALAFVPVLAEPAMTALAPAPAPPLELQLAGAMLRIPPGTDGALLTMVLRALRASAA